MLYYLFAFFMDVIGHIFKVWQSFQIVPGVNYLEFYCAGLLLVFFSYVIFGPIKTAVRQELVSSVRTSIRNTRNDKKNSK